MTLLSSADVRLQRWAPSGAARLLIATVFTLSAAMQIVGVPFTSSFGTRTRIDLDVYRLGAQIWQHGQSLYADGSMPFTSDGIWLPFTYPPFAALGFVPLGALGLEVAGLLMSVVTIALVVAIVRLFLRLLSIGGPRNRWWMASLITAGVIWMNPYWMTIGFGQINVILMALIVVDIFVLGRGRAVAAGPLRGVLTGVAAAIKLTPMVFVAVFGASRRWRAGVIAVGTFLLAGAVAWAWMPADSAKYWTHTLFHTTRIGDPAGRINQNLNAMWIRLIPGSESTQQLMWVLSSLVVTVLAVLAVRACRPVSAFDSLKESGNTASAHHLRAVVVACAVAIWGLLVSPTSWAHHWVWSVPMILAAAVVSARSSARSAQLAYGLIAGTGTLIFALGPFQFLSPAVRHWSVFDHIVGNAYSLWGLAVLLIVWQLPPRPASGPQAAKPGSAESGLAPSLSDAA